MPRGTFRGGIHPPGNKSLTSGLPTEPAKQPSKICVPLNTASLPLTSLVAKGDTVRRGQMVANTDAKFGVPMHSPVSGKVTGISAIRTCAGIDDMAIIIENDGNDTLDESCVPMTNVMSMSRDEIIAAIRGAGIVGMGGAMFPTHIKLAVPPSAKVDTLLLNGAECEPYLTADHRLMLERPDDVIAGAQIIMRAIDVKTCIIGIEDNKPDAVASMGKAAAKASGIQVMAVHTMYPQGSEKHLIKSALGRAVPPGCLPFQVGVVVSNVGTAAAVADKFYRGLPLIDRVVTITGSAVARPANLLMKIGTLASELVEQCGGVKGELGKAVFGGPMMGQAVWSLDVPTTKGTSGILLMTAAEAVEQETLACIRCGRCVDACPMRLEPALLHQWAQQKRWSEAENYHALDCIECGACAYSCPSGRPLVQAIRHAKFEINAIKKAARERGAK
ncbi:MAG: Electron transport complex protein RnfC [Firmicutes bacterium ADurb.Bin506]|jgi:electron transport complex protein RnfC|nr:MAG: Electron transport complex protein RnfC [Firmicutes bacterium ADurb.Bin506]